MECAQTSTNEIIRSELTHGTPRPRPKPSSGHSGPLRSKTSNLVVNGFGGVILHSPIFSSQRNCVTLSISRHQGHGQNRRINRSMRHGTPRPRPKPSSGHSGPLRSKTSNLVVNGFGGVILHSPIFSSQRNCVTLSISRHQGHGQNRRINRSMRLWAARNFDLILNNNGLFELGTQEQDGSLA